MNLITRLANLLFKSQKLLEMIAIFLLLSTVSFSFNKKQIRLIWSDYPFIALTIVFILIIIAIIWIQIQKQKLNSLTNELKDMRKGNNISLNDKVKELSARQHEVLKLINEGKSNKEIMMALNIELSTLKTHINQLYKTLEIRNRREAKSLQKDWQQGN